MLTYHIRLLVGFRNLALQDQNKDFFDLSASFLSQVTFMVIGLVNSCFELVT